MSGSIVHLQEPERDEQGEIFDERQDDHQGAGQRHVDRHERHLPEVGRAVPGTCEEAHEEKKTQSADLLQRGSSSRKLLFRKIHFGIISQ